MKPLGSVMENIFYHTKQWGVVHNNIDYAEYPFKYPIPSRRIYHGSLGALLSSQSKLQAQI